MIKRFVITGGPCSGKTTAMSRLTELLQRKGFRVFVAEEAATLGWNGGVLLEDLAKPECEEAFLELVMNYQLILEDHFFKFAKATGQNCVILCDRGLMDGFAYVSTEQWVRVLSRMTQVPYTTKIAIEYKEKVDTASLNNVSVCYLQRYDAVFHLVTAADGAQAFYSLENNLGARHETPEKAIAQDLKTRNAWSRHSHHFIIDNKDNKDFEQKLEELYKCVLAFL